MRITKFSSLPPSDARIIWILTRGYVRTLQKRLGSEHGGAVREAAVRMLKQLMPLKRGRPNDEQIDVAERLRKEGLKYAEIAARVIPGFQEEPPHRKRSFLISLSSAVSKRRARSRRHPGRRQDDDKR